MTDVANPPQATNVESVGIGLPGDLTAANQRTASSDKSVDPSRRPTLPEAVCGLFALVAWLGLFGAGAVLSTKVYRDALSSGGHLSMSQEAGYFAITLSCYTVMNLFFLACISSYLGRMASRWQVEKAVDVTITLENNFINTYRNRTTIEADYTIDKAHKLI